MTLSPMTAPSGPDRFLHQRLAMLAVALLFVVTALAGCRYEGTANLHQGMTRYSPASFFGPGDHAFRDASTGEHLFIAVEKDKALVIRSSLKPDQTPNTARNFLIVSDSTLPVGTYLVAVPVGGSSFTYYAFVYTKDLIVWISPKQTRKPQSKRDLLNMVLADRADRTTWKRFARLEGSARTTALASLDTQMRANAAKKTAAAAVTARSKLADLDIGDMIYVRGVLSDELAMVQRIELATGRVKVRRQRDGTSTWITAADVLTREQSTAQDIGRAGVGLAFLYCLANPKECQTR